VPILRSTVRLSLTPVKGQPAAPVLGSWRRRGDPLGGLDLDLAAVVDHRSQLVQEACAVVAQVV